MIGLLFALALVVGVLVGLGAHQLSRPRDGRLSPGALSASAIDLGYKTERDFRMDSQRAETALAHVLAAGPGAQELWDNAETGNRGLIWASEENRRGDGTLCRNLARRTLINGAFRNAAGTACRTEISDWRQTGQWRPD
jgi:surface antigen